MKKKISSHVNAYSQELKDLISTLNQNTMMGGVMTTKHQVKYEEGSRDINRKEKLRI